MKRVATTDVWVRVSDTWWKLLSPSGWAITSSKLLDWDSGPAGPAAAVSGFGEPAGDELSPKTAEENIFIADSAATHIHHNNEMAFLIAKMITKAMPKTAPHVLYQHTQLYIKNTVYNNTQLQRLA